MLRTPCLWTWAWWALYKQEIPPLPPSFGSAGKGRDTSIEHSRATPAARAVLSASGRCCPLGAGPTAALPCVLPTASSPRALYCLGHGVSLAVVRSGLHPPQPAVKPTK